MPVLAQKKKCNDCLKTKKKETKNKFVLVAELDSLTKYNKNITICPFKTSENDQKKECLDRSISNGHFASV